MTLSKYPARNLTVDEIDHCLLVLAAHGANLKQAREQLLELYGEQKAPSEATLRIWRRSKYVDRYHEIAAGLDQAARDKRHTQGYREMTQQAQDNAALVLNRLSDNIDKLDAKDLATTASKLAITAGIATEKTLLLEGRPTAIVETRSPDWYDAQLAKIIDSDAEEITDAEIVEESPLDLSTE